jgi:predicted restriction endonuclease
MNLYCCLPFGRQHSRAPEVIALAKILGRTPGSVSMKLNNFTSLDPEEAKRGVVGLTGASQLDRKIWNEFYSDWEAMAIESENLWQRIVVSDEPLHEGKSSKKDINEMRPPKATPTGPTEGERVVRVRYAQDFFRRTVLAAYNMRCCISGIPVPGLLIASHILPWSKYPAQRINPHNGLCLSTLHDAAFDKGLITFDEDNRLVLSKRLKYFLPNDSLRENFVVFEGALLTLPEKFIPDTSFITTHREKIFQ